MHHGSFINIIRVDQIKYELLRTSMCRIEINKIRRHSECPMRYVTFIVYVNRYVTLTVCYSFSDLRVTWSTFRTVELVSGHDSVWNKDIP